MSAARLLLTLAVMLLSAMMLTEGLRMATEPKSCCFSFATKELKPQQVSSYRKTSQQCPSAAVVFTTRRGYKVCAKSSEPWVQTLISKIEDRKALQ
ncbi:monocyte chemotactic protein 1B-like [Brienomyrus brachyistius]|uniref:monocyte chemotactic protein 1B-like n=1 Tax=Brienomyrus brachyistius TaxID=42636 RepID=UPI0020B40A19|nr:monocyte chemotactic protein 1B-like [Brienomyrus brachyistius]